jgi:hypothetical protein
MTENLRRRLNHDRRTVSLLDRVDRLFRIDAGADSSRSGRHGSPAEARIGEATAVAE